MSIPSVSAWRSMFVKRTEAVVADPLVCPSVFHDLTRMSCFLHLLVRVGWGVRRVGWVSCSDSRCSSLGLVGVWLGWVFCAGYVLGK